MPMVIIPMLKLSPKIDQGLSTITCKVLSDLVDVSLLETIEKQDHTLLLKKDSDLKIFLLWSRSRDLRRIFQRRRIPDYPGNMGGTPDTPQHGNTCSGTQGGGTGTDHYPEPSL